MHKSVLLKEAIESLNIKNDGIYVDATLGYGGHSSKILEKLDKGLLICLDQDEEAISYSKKRLSEISNNFKIIKTNFERLKDVLDEINISKVEYYLILEYLLPKLIMHLVVLVFKKIQNWICEWIKLII